MRALLVCCLALWPWLAMAQGEDQPLSGESELCVECHQIATPGVVAAWRQSRHSQTTPAQARAKPALEKRMSAATPPASPDTAVGCYECHGLNTEQHPDSFAHFGFNVSMIVTPNDCATCHSDEAQQFADTKKANAFHTLADNPLFTQLVHASTSSRAVADGQLNATGSSENAQAEACYACHGTKIEIDGTRKVESELGEVEVPKLKGWPNTGVGRQNPDGSQGSCSACHTRHTFSIAMARKPETCGHCHLQPDVPAYEVYSQSRHGRVYQALGRDWDYEAVPWRLGRDIETPTCATCHNSLVTAGDQEPKVLAQRTHDFGARMWQRLFGLPYSHPQPVHGRTWELRNADGQPLPVSLDGTPAALGLISADEQAARQAAFGRVCVGCHSSSTPENHFARFNQTVKETDGMVKAATDLVRLAWDKQLANPANMFDEHIEHLWIDQWLNYANSARLGSAMAGPDLIGFEYGWHYLNKNLQEMGEWLADHDALAHPTITAP